jgi:hypothetical protein
VVICLNNHMPHYAEEKVTVFHAILLIFSLTPPFFIEDKVELSL